MTTNDEWLRQMGELTAAHRAANAAKLTRLAKQRLWADRAAGYTDAYAKGSGDWYRARARGQAERIERVAECGAETLEITYAGCRQKHERRSACLVHLLCVPCKAFVASKKRTVFRRAREVTVAAVAKRGLLKGWNRWSEKLLSLTTPHFPNQSIPERIYCVLRAWGRFLRRLNKHWLDQKEVSRILQSPRVDHRGRPAGASPSSRARESSGVSTRILGHSTDGSRSRIACQEGSSCSAVDVRVLPLLSYRLCSVVAVLRAVTPAAARRTLLRRELPRARQAHPLAERAAERRAPRWLVAAAESRVAASGRPPTIALASASKNLPWWTTRRAPTDPGRLALRLTVLRVVVRRTHAV